MPKITITTNDGKVIQIIEAGDIGDLNMAMPRHNLLFEIVQEHLVIVDPANEHALIFRDVGSSDPLLRGEVFLAFKARQSLPISAWVRQLQTSKGRGSVTFRALTAEPVIAG